MCRAVAIAVPTPLNVTQADSLGAARLLAGGELHALRDGERTHASSPYDVWFVQAPDTSELAAPHRRQ